VTAEEAIRTTRSHIEGKFPKTCSTCNRVFATLAEYLLATRHVGSPVSYDAEDDDWTPTRPLGTQSLANCPCGSTLAIDSSGMSLWSLWRLMRWGRAEARRRSITMAELLAWVRAEIDDQVLREYREAMTKPET
jgi:hypothetical protein